MSQVQIISATPNVKVANSPNKVLIPSSGIDANSLLVTSSPTAAQVSKVAAASTSANQVVFKSPLKKRPYRLAEQHYQDDGSTSKRVRVSAAGGIIDASELSEHVVIVDSVTTDQSVPELQSVNMADVASTVYEAYVETVQFTFNNTVNTRENISSKLACPAANPTLDDHTATVCWKSYEARFNEAITDVVNFAKRIPGFAALETDDQIILIKGGSFEVSGGLPKIACKCFC